MHRGRLSCRFECNSILMRAHSASRMHECMHSHGARYLARPTREDDGHGERPRWRTDGGRVQTDALHSMPGVDPMNEPPRGTRHAYGANGFGKLRNALVEPRASHIWFVVRQPRVSVGGDGSGTRSPIVVQTSDATWHAYNGWGGFTTYGSFKLPYTHGPNPRFLQEHEHPIRAHKRSYNTPVITRDYRPVNMPLNSEYVTQHLHATLFIQLQPLREFVHAASTLALAL
jgi:hypothetical protein